MTDSKDRKYLSGKEVLEKFIPGYSPPEPVIQDDLIEPEESQSSEEVTNFLLSGLKTKLEELNIP